MAAISSCAAGSGEPPVRHFPKRRVQLVGELMDARRAVGTAMRAGSGMADAREKVDRAKRALGERGPAWWDDGAPDYNRHMARNTPHADWFASRS